MILASRVPYALFGSPYYIISYVCHHVLEFTLTPRLFFAIALASAPLPAQHTLMPADSSGPTRYLSRKSTAPRTTKARGSWRSRLKRKYIKRTAAEKKAIKSQRRERKLSYNEALNAASGVMYDEASKMREQFGQHSIEYYMEALMQRSRLTNNKRDINRWNVFLREETIRHNEG